MKYLIHSIKLHKNTYLFHYSPIDYGHDDKVLKENSVNHQ